MQTRVALPLAALAFVLPCTSLAIDGVHDTTWYPRDFASPWSIGSSSLFVTFEARWTAVDASSGLSFSIAGFDAETNSAEILTFAQVVDNPPPVGNPVTVTVAFRVTCSPQSGVLQAEVTRGSFSYCHPNPDFAGVVHMLDRESGISTEALADPFGFVVLDDQGNRTDAATPANAFACNGGSAMAAFDEAAVYGRVAALKSQRLTQTQKAGDSGTIGVYFDEAGTQCTGTIRPDEPNWIYVLIKQAGLTDCGVAAAEFRFDGIPDGWVVVPSPNPDMLAIGDPFGNGVSCAFKCARPEDGVHLLYRAVIFATDEREDLEFTLKPRNPPTTRELSCPMILMCDEPYFTPLCVEAVPCYVNTSATKECAIPVAVTHDTWSGVKALYR